jgi:hypothetical protein
MTTYQPAMATRAASAMTVLRAGSPADSTTSRVIASEAP